MRQGLVAWLLTGVLALVAFDAFESIKTGRQDSVQVGTGDVLNVAKDGNPPPPTGN